MIQIINDILKQIKTAKPLVLNISNQVTMDLVANGLLSLGASPIMTQAIHEVEDLIKLASAVVINTGTLNEEFLSLADYACMQANRWQKPLVLDPVGIGASDYRSSHCDRLLRQFNFQLIRGNASEIAALAGLKISSRGVDTSLCTESAVEGGKNWLKRIHPLLLSAALWTQ